MDVAITVVAILNTTRLELGNRGRHIGCHRSGLWVRHQSTRSKKLAQLSNNRHHVWRCNGDVKIERATFGKLRGKLGPAHDVSAGLFCRLGVFACCENTYPHVLAGAMWQADGPTDNLVGLAWVDTQQEHRINALVKRSVREALYCRYRVLRCV